MKKLIFTAVFLLLTAFLLLCPAVAVSLALGGLNLWFERMVPALLPFMILSGMMIRLDLTDKIMVLFRPVLQPVLRLRPTPLYAVVIGFLCGFPMGARVVADLYTRRKITKDEADYLLAFCNNIGPIYFTGFVLTTLELKKTAPFLLGMYGLPLIYGIVLRYTFYRRRLSVYTPQTRSIMNRMPAAGPELSSAELIFAAPPPTAIKTGPGLLAVLDDSVTAGMEGIAQLGGYMVFFNLLKIIPLIIWGPGQATAVLGCLLEITGGIQAIGARDPLAVLVLLSFGGLSCLAQTNGCIRRTDLSLKAYFMHKAILTALSLCYYLIIFSM